MKVFFKIWCNTRKLPINIYSKILGYKVSSINNAEFREIISLSDVKLIAA